VITIHLVLICLAIVCEALAATESLTGWHAPWLPLGLILFFASFLV
jgi:hypothetical protein